MQRTSARVAEHRMGSGERGGEPALVVCEPAVAREEDAVMQAAQVRDGVADLRFGHPGRPQAGPGDEPVVLARHLGDANVHPPSMR